MIEDRIWLGQTYVEPESNDREAESQKKDVGDRIANHPKLNYILLPKSQHRQRTGRLESNANHDRGNAARYACEATIA